MQQAEFDEAGKQLKVAVKPADVTKNLQKLELQYAKGADGKVDAAKWQKVLADNHTSEALVVEELRDGLLRQAIYVKLTKSVAVNNPAVAAYYAKNKAQYSTPASRQVRHILVKDKAIADKIYAQLSSSDAQFAALAKKYTIDPGSKSSGGKLGASRRVRPSPSSTRSPSASRPARSPRRSRAPTAGT